MDIADGAGNQVLQTEGHYVLGGVRSGWVSSSRLAWSWRRPSLYEPARSDLHLALFAQDPHAVCLVRLAWTSWYLGRLDDVCRWPIRRSSTPRVGHPFTTAYVRTMTALLALDAGDFDRMQEAIASLPDEATTAVWVSIAQRRSVDG